ncbi:MAG: hypothetical protein QW818_03860, partial [Candidatus Aenigmatarchaeota archaeon]
LNEASKPEFKEYGKQIVKNAKALAEELINNGLKLVSGGTDNHMILIDLTSFGKGHGIFVQEALDVAGITVNKNTIPNDPSSPFYPSGVRLGTPALTTRGMKEGEMKIIGKLIAQVIYAVKDYRLPEDKDERVEYLKKFREEIKNNEMIKIVRQQVSELCNKFLLYPNL